MMIWRSGQNHQEKLTFLAAFILKPSQNHTNTTKGVSSACINTDQYKILLQDVMLLQDEFSSVFNPQSGPVAKSNAQNGGACYVQAL